MVDSAKESCSGIIRVGANLKCKHGFPFVPNCRRNPMEDNGVYGRKAPCCNEKWTELLYPEHGAPEQPDKEDK